MSSARTFANKALSALNSDKPHSSITDWVEILTGPSILDEAYDGIPELVDAISLQPTGPTEASRALRKKLKHGDAHRQYRALVILKALVENGGPKFQGGFADSQLTDAIRQLAGDPSLDPKVRRKLNLVLGSWYRQFKDDPKMSTVAGLYKSTRDPSGLTLFENSDSVRAYQAKQREQQAKLDRERQEEKQRLKREKEEAKRKKNQKPARPQGRSTRKPFNFEQEKPKVMAALIEASQASNNLLNALQHVNREQESVQTNARVQECLASLKQIRKIIVRYVQLVEDEQYIGTLIDTNERVISALETYDSICTAESEPTEGTAEPLRPNDTGDSELGKLQAKQRERVARSIHRDREGSGSIHPDLEDLSFGTLGSSNRGLPPPIRPTAADADSDGENDRPSLSDFSDYDSSDEEYSRRRSQDSGGSPGPSQSRLSDDEDPFADPFADGNEVSTPGINERKQMNW